MLNGCVTFLDSKIKDLKIDINNDIINLDLNNNISVRAGHGLTFENVKNIIKISGIEELNIGHFIIGEAIFYGLENVILKMIKLMKKK